MPLKGKLPWEGTLRKMLYGLVVLAIAAGAAFVFGPRVETNTIVSFDANVIGADPEAYLAKTEGTVQGIHDNLQKEIIWAVPGSK